VGAAGEKKVVEYDGARELAGFKAFLKKHAPTATAAASETEDDLSLHADL